MGGDTYSRKHLVENLKSITVCEKCGSSQISTSDSRETMGLRRRTKICTECRTKFTTYEVHKDDILKLATYSKVMNDEAVELISEFSKLSQQVSQITEALRLE